ncbi:hypothetical protein MKX01_013167 [Papaver californicum]|nr:hypothetical protein MKX01_013167 [Papaver californicum]
MGVKLFGVTIMKKEEESMKKSLSMGNLLHAHHNHLDHDRGYLSDGPNKRDSHERKRGVPWTEEEHAIFLKGLEKLGKSSSSIKKKRRSLFDLHHHKGNRHTALSNLNPTKQLTQQMAALATTATPRPSMENSIWSKPALTRASVEPSLWPKPAPTYAITPNANISHMVGGSAGRSNYAGLSMVPTMNYANSGYFYASQSINELAVGPHLGISNSSAVKTDLKPSIGGHSPTPKDRNKFSSETSNLISFI